MAYSETARACDYILPCLSYMESYDTTSFAHNYPNVFFQLRQPVVEPISNECKEGSAIMLDLFKAMGYMPKLPDHLYEAGKKGITAYLNAMNDYLKETPQYRSMMPMIMAETLGPVMGSVNLALIVGLLANSSPAFKTGAAAMGYPKDSTMVEAIYKDILAHPEGLMLAKFQGDNFSMLRTEDKKIALKIDELQEAIESATIEAEMAKLKMPDQYPMVLHSGLHLETVINTTLRNPEWNKSRRWGTLLVNEADAVHLGLTDGGQARVTTQASSVEIEVEISPRAAVDCVYIPHGGGLIYNGKKYGVNVNELVKSTDRDEMCTPMHRRIPCRVEKV